MPRLIHRTEGKGCGSIQRPGLFPDWPDWTALPTGPGYPATYRFKALSLATACLLTALAAASFLATGLLACG